MPDPYEVDDEGNPVAERPSAPGPDPAEEEAIRRQVESTLRVMKVSMIVGVVILAILAIAVSSLRGVFILAAIIYLCGSLATQWYLRRKFIGQLTRQSTAS